jgi:hypothetical protein
MSRVYREAIEPGLNPEQKQTPDQPVPARDQPWRAKTERALPRPNAIT